MPNSIKLRLNKSLFSAYTTNRSKIDKFSDSIIGLQSVVALSVILYHIL